MRRFFLIYSAALAAFVAAFAALLAAGERLYPRSGMGPQLWAPPPPAAAGQGAIAGIVLLQMLVVIAAARGLGGLFRRLGQPAVIGEIFAGLLLGPSFLGLLWPQALAWLFAPASLGPLQLLAQLGVLLFMFAVGMEVDLAQLRRSAASALAISHAGIAVPFLLGVALTLWAYPQLAPSGVPFTALAPFMGVALAVTAFPVLARILDERRLLRTPLGQAAVAMAAIGDVTAWCLLAAVVAWAKARGLAGAALSALAVLVLVAGLHRFGKPLLARACARHRAGAAALGLLSMLLCAAATDALGIHALFGAFLAGTVMPAQAALRIELKERLHAFSGMVLLPLFFALTGLRTQVGLLHGAADWLLCAAVVAAAVAGKLGGTLLAARAAGRPWRESLALGALMNTRGLMELVVLNLGYELGILPQRVFAMLVLMALLTTCMTGPLLGLVLRRGEAPMGAPQPPAQ